MLTFTRHTQQTSPIRRPERYPGMQPDPSVRRLTPREHEIVLLVADGLKPTLIARRLNLAAHTAATYLQRIRSRLKLTTQAEIVAWVAARRGPGCLDALRRADDRRGQSARPHQQRDGQLDRREPGATGHLRRHQVTLWDPDGSH